MCAAPGSMSASNSSRTKAPDDDDALAAVEGMRQRRVMISATGYHANTLKIHPSLIFTPAHADRLVSAFGGPR